MHYFRAASQILNQPSECELERWHWSLWRGLVLKEANKKCHMTSGFRRRSSVSISIHILRLLLISEAQHVLRRHFSVGHGRERTQKQAVAHTHTHTHTHSVCMGSVVAGLWSLKTKNVIMWSHSMVQMSRSEVKHDAEVTGICAHTHARRKEMRILTERQKQIQSRKPLYREYSSVFPIMLKGRSELAWKRMEGGEVEERGRWSRSSTNTTPRGKDDGTM